MSYGAGAYGDYAYGQDVPRVYVSVNVGFGVKAGAAVSTTGKKPATASIGGAAGEAAMPTGLRKASASAGVTAGASGTARSTTPRAATYGARPGIAGSNTAIVYQLRNRRSGFPPGAYGDFAFGELGGIETSGGPGAILGVKAAQSGAAKQKPIAESVSLGARAGAAGAAIANNPGHATAGATAGDAVTPGHVHQTAEPALGTKPGVSSAETARGERSAILGEISGASAQRAGREHASTTLGAEPGLTPSRRGTGEARTTLGTTAGKGGSEAGRPAPERVTLGTVLGLAAAVHVIGARVASFGSSAGDGISAKVKAARQDCLGVAAGTAQRIAVRIVARAFGAVASASPSPKAVQERRQTLGSTATLPAPSAHVVSSRANTFGAAAGASGSTLGRSPIALTFASIIAATGRRFFDLRFARVLLGRAAAGYFTGNEMAALHPLYRFTQGDTWPIFGELFYADGKPFSLAAGASVVWELQDEYGEVVLSYSYPGGANIDVTDVDARAPDVPHHLLITVNAADTASIKPGPYKDQLRATDPGGLVSTQAVGTIEVDKSFFS